MHAAVQQEPHSEGSSGRQGENDRIDPEREIDEWFERRRDGRAPTRKQEDDGHCEANDSSEREFTLPLEPLDAAESRSRCAIGLFAVEKLFDNLLLNSVRWGRCLHRHRAVERRGFDWCEGRQRQFDNSPVLKFREALQDAALADSVVARERDVLDLGVLQRLREHRNVRPVLRLQIARSERQQVPRRQ
nr:hypothetical protein [Pseudoclavibacter sp. CFCC 14310]